MLVLFGWFWRGNEPKHLVEAAQSHPPRRRKPAGEMAPS
jgi:hypothetical protein